MCTHFAQQRGKIGEENPHNLNPQLWNKNQQNLGVWSLKRVIKAAMSTLTKNKPEQ